MGPHRSTREVVVEVAADPPGQPSPLIPLSLVCRWYRTRLAEIKRLIKAGSLTHLRGCGSDGVLLEQREVEQALAVVISPDEAIVRLDKAPPDTVEDLIPSARAWGTFPTLLPKVQAHYPEISLRDLRRLDKAGKLRSVRHQTNVARSSFRAQLGPLLADLARLSTDGASDADLIEASVEQLRSEGHIPAVRKPTRLRRARIPR